MTAPSSQVTPDVTPDGEQVVRCVCQHRDPLQLTTTFCLAILPSASNRNVSVACAYPDVGQRHTRNTEPAGASPLSSTRIAGAASPVVSDRLANSPVKHSRMRARPLYSSRAPLVWLYTLIT